jgi:hypothetical protein
MNYCERIAQRAFPLAPLIVQRTREFRLRETDPRLLWVQDIVIERFKKIRMEAAGIAPASDLTQVVIQIEFVKTAPMGCRKGVGTAWHFRSLSRAGTACRLPSGPRSWNWCGVAESHYTGWRLEELYLPPENQASWSSRAGTGRSIPWRLRNSL